ncbi:cytochrome P450 [Favolaschia claudopus]|uniref:Cytochrome P450 n=1 Tax=Favolaschia claudopus TaxID=2862362 RepID=A0AAW0AUB9_9AGAR
MAGLSFLAAVVAAVTLYVLFRLFKVYYAELTCALRRCPGPRNEHWLIGNRTQFFNNLDGKEGIWTKEYGRVVRVNGVLRFSMLYTTDTKAIQHVLSNNYIYQKSESGRWLLSRLGGPGVLVVEEDEHKSLKQRKIMNPAFGPVHLRALTELFIEKSKQLRDVWAAKAVENGGVANINVIPEFSTAALDIIGKAGFNYDFNAVGTADSGYGIRDELHEAFTKVSALGDVQKSFLGVLKLMVPSLRPYLPNTNIDRTIEAAQPTMRRIGYNLLAESKRQVAAGNMDIDNRSARDLLSLLVRANMDKAIPESQRLSDEDVVAQVPTFLVAGHETTSTAATWVVFELARNPAVQNRLRTELLAVDNDNTSMDDLNALPYLDCVVRETLRAHAPVPVTFRVAMRDDVIPLAHPYTDCNGIVHDTLHLRKGQLVQIPILAINRDPEIWGPDAVEFLPERWERTPVISASIPGVWGQMLTFLGGARACIGFRFSIMELKAILFTLVRALEFELAVPGEDVGRVMGPVLQLPIVRRDKKAGGQLPVLIKPFIAS